MIDDLNYFIFSSTESFSEKAIKIFQFQYRHNEVYKRFADTLNCKPRLVNTIKEIPFLPISFFKTHKIITTDFSPEQVFKSSGTTGTVNSQHLVKDISIYEASFTSGFKSFYGNIRDYCIIGLLPSYLERKDSSLVYMVEKLMQQSGHPLNGFHLYDYPHLADKLVQLEQQEQKTLLIGVTYALLQFAEEFPLDINHTIIMETGGMKGRKEEIVRGEVHRLLKEAFSVKEIHSEYGMTELLSQAYSLNEGIFQTPPWMKILIRDEDDPLNINYAVNSNTTGAINIIDLANIFSCSFIATDDIGRLYPNGNFEVLGRMDNSDIRGCSLLSL
jgi:phenylacetate-coenzyme A ligase PaaK-like adenylate-forming protein